MKQNVIFWCAVNNKDHSDKYDSFKWFEYSKISWQYWCKKNNVIFYEYTKPGLDDLMAHRVTWQRWFDVYDQVEAAGIDYDKIFMVDATTIIKWDAPNIFNLCNDDRLVAWRDSDNLAWVYNSIKGWENYFNFYNFDIKKYINCGSVIINKTHKPFIDAVKKFYFDNYNDVMNIQHTLKLGSDQTPFNFLLQLYNIDMNLDLPIAYNMRHLNRKEFFSFNWQLNEDVNPFCTKYVYISRFTGFAKEQRTAVMSYVWNFIKYDYSEKYEILKTLRHKDTFKNATTKKFKVDLIDFFENKKYTSCVELGACQGDTTAILSTLFEIVKAYDYNPDNILQAKEKCKHYNNIEFFLRDLYKDQWDFIKPDVIFFDHTHEYTKIKEGLQYIKNNYSDTIVIMDDYGHEMNTVKPVIDELIRNNEIEVLQWIGEEKGFMTSNAKKFVDKEGLIFKFK